MKNQLELRDSFTKSLFNESKDLNIDLSEVVIDNVLENDIVKEIPIVKSIVAATNMGLRIKERHFAKKSLVLLKQFWSSSIDEDKLNKFKSRLNIDSKYTAKVMEQLLIILDRYIEEEKAVIMGKLLASHVNDKLNEEEFFEYIIILDQLYVTDFKVLRMYYDKTKEIESTNKNKFINFEKDKGIKINSSVQRLRTHGFLDRNNAAMLSGGLDDSVDVESTIHSFGIKFCEYGLFEEV
ncbi:hypothetical protein AMS62_19630 [Bacillus sp. FJAT-18019]|nr:hypothetical protein AMS62_19630 [Bacillus sp. FJAT-18019]